MSPEQATADRVVDGRTDIFSLGAMTYEMLAGIPRMWRAPSQAVIAKLLTEKPAGVRTHRPNVPPHVEAAIAHALEKLPADRCATAKELPRTSWMGRATTTSTISYVAAAGCRANRAGARDVRREHLGVGRRRHLRRAGGVADLSSARTGLGAFSRPIRVTFDLPPADVRINDVLTGSTIAVTPLGDAMAFTTTGHSWFKMYLRRFDEITAHEIAFKLAGAKHHLLRLTAAGSPSRKATRSRKLR